MKYATPETHTIVSNIKTPDDYISNKDPYGKNSNLDYIELAWMKYLADRYYPGWTWTIISAQVINIDNKPTFILETGVLEWTEEIKDSKGTHHLDVRRGAMTAAHRIMYSGEKLTDPGNDAKAVTTDTLKKAFNMYMNIGDDIYRNEHPQIDKAMEEEILNLANELEEAGVNIDKYSYESIKKGIEDLKITKENIKVKMDMMKMKLSRIPTKPKGE